MATSQELINLQKDLHDKIRNPIQGNMAGKIVSGIMLAANLLNGGVADGATQSWVESQNYATQQYVADQLTPYALAASVPTNNNQLTNGAGYQTALQVQSTLSNYATQQYVADQLTPYALAASVPTNNNQLTNGAGYQTALQVQSTLSNYARKDVAETFISTLSATAFIGDGALVTNVDAARIGGIAFDQLARSDIYETFDAGLSVVGDLDFIGTNREISFNGNFLINADGIGEADLRARSGYNLVLWSQDIRTIELGSSVNILKNTFISQNLTVTGNINSSVVNGFLIKNSSGNDGIYWDGAWLHLQTFGSNGVSVSGTSVILRNSTINGTAAINGTTTITGDGTNENILLRFGLDGGRDWSFRQSGSGAGTHLLLRSESSKDFILNSTSFIIRNPSNGNTSAVFNTAAQRVDFYYPTYSNNTHTFNAGTSFAAGASITGNLTFNASENAINWASGNGVIEAPNIVYVRATGGSNLVSIQNNGGETHFGGNTIVSGELHVNQTGTTDGIVVKDTDSIGSSSNAYMTMKDSADSARGLVGMVGSVFRISAYNTDTEIELRTNNLARVKISQTQLISEVPSIFNFGITTTTGAIESTATSINFLNTPNALPTRHRGIQLSTWYTGTIPDEGILFGTDTTLTRTAVGVLTASGTIAANTVSATTGVFTNATMGGSTIATQDWVDIVLGSYLQNPDLINFLDTTATGARTIQGDITFSQSVDISIAAGPFLRLIDNNGAGSAAAPWFGFYGSNLVRLGYIGYSTANNDVLSITNETGDLAFDAGTYTTTLQSLNGYFLTPSWIKIGAANGIYSDTNSAHFFPTPDYYGTWQINGSKNGYAGINFSAAENVTLMYDSAANGGIYNQDRGKWHFYYSEANDCLGIGSSATNASYVAQVNGNLNVTGDITGTFTGTIAGFDANNIAAVNTNNFFQTTQNIAGNLTLTGTGNITLSGSLTATGNIVTNGTLRTGAPTGGTARTFKIGDSQTQSTWVFTGIVVEWEHNGVKRYIPDFGIPPI